MLQTVINHMICHVRVLCLQVLIVGKRGNGFVPHSAYHSGAGVKGVQITID